jgi:hypothetical protein
VEAVAVAVPDYPDDPDDIPPGMAVTGEAGARLIFGKRGRPKGSKNKPKAVEVAPTPVAVAEAPKPKAVKPARPEPQRPILPTLDEARAMFGLKPKG